MPENYKLGLWEIGNSLPFWLNRKRFCRRYDRNGEREIFPQFAELEFGIASKTSILFIIHSFDYQKQLQIILQADYQQIWA